MNVRAPKSLRDIPLLERLADWPRLLDGTFEYKSDYGKAYNCTAWAVNETNRLIDSYGYWWPDDIKPTHTAENYAEMYRKHYGFEDCDNGDLEKGIEKLAIFSKDNLFTHVARQLENGIWSSKMGEYEDIEHFSLDSVGGGDYGKVVMFLKRARAS